jgi:hypothetical protein
MIESYSISGGYYVVDGTLLFEDVKGSVYTQQKATFVATFGDLYSREH